MRRRMSEKAQWMKYFADGIYVKSSRKPSDSTIE
jgi:hypothetical protein